MYILIVAMRNPEGSSRGPKITELATGRGTETVVHVMLTVSGKHCFYYFCISERICEPGHVQGSCSK